LYSVSPWRSIFQDTHKKDEHELSNALVAILKHNKYSVDAVYDGEEALEYLEADNYDGVILDIMMPKVDGLEVLRELRLKGNKIPVLMLTAKSEIDDRVKGLDYGADDYLTKPFATKELLARIRSITRRQVEIIDSILFMGNTKLNRLTYELSTEKEIICLSNKEFQIMELFMANPKQYFSAERMIEKIWGFDTEVDISVVWVYISNIRKKMVTIEADIQIRAARNIGYTLEMKK
jgi:DNA-binding response OmpR family regulator